MKLLIVDDEVRQVKALASVIRKIKPHFAISEAYDGDEAWRLIQESPVDAVITDIRMPVVDGMGLIERINSSYPRIKIALVSGYGEFGYAQKAIRSNVIEYIIKPVSYANIQEILMKFEALHAKERAEERARDLWIERMINRYIHGCIPAEELLQLKELFPFGQPGYIGTLELPSDQDVRQVLNMHLYKSELFRGWQELGMLHVCADNTKPRRILLIQWLRNHRLPANELRNRIRHHLEPHVLAAFPQAVLGISAIRQSIMDELSSAYRESVTALDYHFYLEDPIVFHDSSWDERTSNDHDLRLDSERFVRLIYARDQIGAVHVINGWFDHHQLRLPPAEMKRRFIQFAAVVNEALKPLSPAIQEECQVMKKTEAIENSRTCSELRQRLKQWAAVWIECLETIGQDKNSLIIQRCKEYLDKHYMEELSLEKIAAMFHFNPSYFSNLFKQKTGVNLTDYIINLRIEQAKRKIAASDARVADVSREVGFRNTAYFIKMFKRRTGLSPNRYRQMAGREH